MTNLYLRLIIFSTFYFTTFNLSAQDLDCETATTFEIGDEWTYTRGSSPIHFSIEEEVEWKGKQALVLRPSFNYGTDYIVQEEGRIYFWDYFIEEYQLNYDFNNDSLYYIKYSDVSTYGADSSAVFIDSVKMEQIDDRDIQVQYCRTDLGFGGVPQPFKVYRGIGASTLGVRLPFLLLDVVIGDLRCFESPDCSIKFVDFPCDTNFTTSVYELKSNIDLKIHPNPVKERLYIETTDQNWSYQVINLQGQQMLQGQYQDHIDVDQLPSGIYFLQMQKDDDLYRTIKFVKE